MDGDWKKDLREEAESGTERGRSPSGVPDSADAPRTPSPEAQHPEVPREPGAQEGEGSPGETLAGAAQPASLGERDTIGPGEAHGAWGGEPPYVRYQKARRAGRRLVRKELLERAPLSAEQRLLLLDTWRRSALPASDFAVLVGISKHTLYAWRARFEREGPSGLLDRPRGGPRGSRLPEITRRTILLLKESHPDWGCERISDLLQRGPALPAGPEAVGRVLKEAGYKLEEVPTHAHAAPEPQRFERARPNQLWQSDLFTFTLKRQNRRLYLVAFLDDHSRFVVGYGLHATQSGALVIEVLRSAVASYRPPEELLTDNGTQYVTWRGKSAFRRELERLGVRHVVSAPRHPQTLGKIERFWGSLWRELVEAALFLDLTDAQRRVGLWIDHYNFQRPHQGLAGLVPADRYFGASQEVLRTLKARVAHNALELARLGIPRRPFYITGSAGGEGFSVHAEGERLILQRSGEREEVELTRPTAPRGEEKLPEPLCPSFHSEPRAEEELGPGGSALDGHLEKPSERETAPKEEGGEA